MITDKDLDESPELEMAYLLAAWDLGSNVLWKNRKTIAKDLAKREAGDHEKVKKALLRAYLLAQHPEDVSKEWVKAHERRGSGTAMKPVHVRRYYRRERNGGYKGAKGGSTKPLDWADKVELKRLPVRIEQFQDSGGTKINAWRIGIAHQPAKKQVFRSKQEAMTAARLLQIQHDRNERNKMRATGEAQYWTDQGKLWVKRQDGSDAQFKGRVNPLWKVQPHPTKEGEWEAVPPKGSRPGKESHAVDAGGRLLGVPAPQRRAAASAARLLERQPDFNDTNFVSYLGQERNSRDFATKALAATAFAASVLTGSERARMLKEFHDAFGADAGKHMTAYWLRYSGMTYKQPQVERGVLYDPQTGRTHRIPPQEESPAGLRRRLYKNLAYRIPDNEAADLISRTGTMPPSEGFIIAPAQGRIRVRKGKKIVTQDAQGQVVYQALGRGKDHFVPFNLTHLSALKGGGWMVRRRVWGGPTVEDVHIALVTGAEGSGIVSRHGVFEIEFTPEFLRARNRLGPEHIRMLNSYDQTLKEIRSGKITDRNGRQLVLNRHGYETALKALQAEFPWYIKRVESLDPAKLGIKEDGSGSQIYEDNRRVQNDSEVDSGFFSRKDHPLTRYKATGGNGKGTAVAVRDTSSDWAAERRGFNQAVQSIGLGRGQEPRGRRDQLESLERRAEAAALDDMMTRMREEPGVHMDSKIEAELRESFGEMNREQRRNFLNVMAEKLGDEDAADVRTPSRWEAEADDEPDALDMLQRERERYDFDAREPTAEALRRIEREEAAQEIARAEERRRQQNRRNVGDE